jgi:hypothetical protein
MEFLRNLFQTGPGIPPQQRAEVNQLIEELIVIGKKEDFLSEYAGGAYNGQYRHLRTRAIGRRLHDLGGIELMGYARDRVRKKLGKNLAAHLEYAWTDVGGWLP